jgi:DNA-binding CsgD family transcriptional regulator
LPEAPPSRTHRDRSIPARRKARQAKAERERGIVNLLNAGVSVAEIAAREGVSLKRTRNLARIIGDNSTQSPIRTRVAPLVVLGLPDGSAGAAPRAPEDRCCDR